MASSSKIATASERLRPDAADVLADVDAAEAELAGQAQRVAREVLVLVPLERVRRELGLREVAHRLEDRRALVVGERRGRGVIVMDIVAPSASSRRPRGAS